LLVEPVATAAFTCPCSSTHLPSPIPNAHNSRSSCPRRRLHSSLIRIVVVL
jgi:hypothetical protein